MQTSEVEDAVSSIEYLRFEKNLQTHLQEVQSRKRGAREEVRIVLPKDVEQVCFLVNDESRDLSRYPELYAQAEGSFENVYFLPSSYGSFGIENISVKQNPLCIRATQSSLSLQLENVGGRVEIEGKESIEASCSNVLYSGEEKIDLVFLGYAYDNTSELSEDISFFLDVLFSTTPFKENKEKFNVYLREELFEDCSFNGNIKCDLTKIIRSATKCPNDYVFLLAKRSEALDLLVPIQSSSLLNVAKINIADNPLVLVHEFGHSFGGLGDEYVNDAQYSSYAIPASELPNCDVSPCAWEGACVPGCSVSSYFRPSDNSLMNNFRIDSGRAFNQVSLDHLNALLEAYE